jgi:hypothetical protein
MECILKNLVSCLVSKHNFTGLANYKIPAQVISIFSTLNLLLLHRGSRITPRSKGYMRHIYSAYIKYQIMNKNSANVGDNKRVAKDV